MFTLCQGKDQVGKQHCNLDLRKGLTKIQEGC